MPASNGIAGFSTPRLTRRPVILAAVTAALIILAAAAIAPFGTRACPVSPPLVLIYAAMMSVTETLTAFFLVVQFRARREPLLGALAGAFGYVAALVFSQMLVFPGVITPHGLFSGGPEASIWMWALWHSGFPIFITIGLLLHHGDKLDDPGSWFKKIGLALIPGGPAIGILSAYLCITQNSHFPPLISGLSYQALRHSPMMGLIIGATVLALLICLWTTRLRDLLSLWLGITLLASVADATLTLSGAVRYDLGWYAGRTLSIVASSIIFCVLIFEMSRLYDLVVEANKDLAHRVMRDGLTGAFNRRYFSEQFPREVLRAKRESTVLALLMIDVDFFKTYNDHHGHQQGDDCLGAIVAAIQTVTRRPGDFVARYGGEEFAVLLPQTDVYGARVIAEKIRATVAALRFASADGSSHAVTVSIGLETLDPTIAECSAVELLKRADQALYRAKREGRNVVRHFEPGCGMAIDDRRLPVAS